MRSYYVYIMASPTRVLSVGFTGNVQRRVSEYKGGDDPGFTSLYGVRRLVHMEEFSNVRDVIAREKQIKAWRREKKVALIEETNPDWRDLSVGWLREPSGEGG